MSRYKYTETEQQMNNVLVYHDQELKAIQEKRDSIDVRGTIDASIELLKSLGYEDKVSRVAHAGTKRKRDVIVLRDWQDIVSDAERQVGDACELEDLFTEEELRENSEAIRLLNREFNDLHRLDKFDVGIAALAAIVGAIVDIVLVGIPTKGPDGLEAGPLSDFIRKKFDEVFSTEEMEKLANSKKSKVSFDAQDNRNTTEYVEGLSSYYHRLLSLGHDPLLGFVFGVYDIMHGTMTTIDKSGKIVCQVMENYADRKESDVVSAIAKQIIHFKSDITTSMGLPAPLMGLFNLLQFGSIGEEEQTIAEIVQGMYYEGFDFIHFCSQSMSVIVIELIVRLGYSIKRIKEGNKVKDSIPISLNRSKHPKLATMLFIGHTGATAVNVGKVYFTKNPLAINYPQWMDFAKYSYKQLRWAVIQKPAMRDAYVEEVLNSELKVISEETDALFEEFCVGRFVVFE